MVEVGRGRDSDNGCEDPPDIVTVLVWIWSPITVEPPPPPSRAGMPPCGSGGAVGSEFLIMGGVG